MPLDSVDPKAATEIEKDDHEAPELLATVTNPAAARAQAKRTAEAGNSLVGKTLAHFQINHLLGEGGMGAVYHATDLALERPVAIKVLGERIAGDPRLRERFYREARSQAQIQHENVCHIYFIGEEKGQLFFAMELIDGESLQERITREEKIEPEEAVGLCQMAASGLRAAHAHGFTHRDIKPSNLMVTKSGMVKVVDFGIVKRTGDDAASKDTALTHEGGSMIGTPLYMAPEQARGDVIDFRADIYALGATLHHLVSGQPPFVGDTPMKVVSQHFSVPRPGFARNKKQRSLPVVDALTDQMMAKRAADRYESYDDLLAAMGGLSARPAGFWVRMTAALIDVLLLSIIGLALLSFLPLGDINDLILLAMWIGYVTVTHGRWGQTLGKAMFDIEVVPVEQAGRLSYKAAGLRALVQMGVPLVLALAAEIVQRNTVPAANAGYVWIVVVLAVLVVALPIGGLIRGVVFGSQKRTRWDRYAGTLVRYRSNR